MSWGPVVAAAALGFAKGFAHARRSPESAPDDTHWVNYSVLAPLREEALYRMAPMHLLGNAHLPVGWTAVPFAMEHVAQESVRGFHGDTSSAFGRFLDVFLGGVLYEKAYRSHGFFGAFAAHALHNLLVGAGDKAGRRVRR